MPNMSESGGTQIAPEAPKYKFDLVRLDQSWHSWPVNAKVEAWKMARAGLRYMGEGEEVQCSWCGVVLGDWQYGDQQLAEHVAAA